jgi:hypothetical protein
MHHECQRRKQERTVFFVSDTADKDLAVEATEALELSVGRRSATMTALPRAIGLASPVRYFRYASPPPATRAVDLGVQTALCFFAASGSLVGRDRALAVAAPRKCMPRIASADPAQVSTGDSGAAVELLGVYNSVQLR